jgi:hypothetical protein
LELLDGWLWSSELHSFIFFVSCLCILYVHQGKEASQDAEGLGGGKADGDGAFLHGEEGRSDRLLQ